MLSRLLLHRQFATQATDFKNFKLTFTSPYKTFFKEQPFKQLNITGTTGAAGILPGHMASVFQLEPSVVECINEQAKTSYFVSGGFLVVHPGGASVDVSVIDGYPIDNFDVNLINQHKSKAENRLSSAKSDFDKNCAELELFVCEKLLQAVNKVEKS